MNKLEILSWNLFSDPDWRGVSKGIELNVRLDGAPYVLYSKQVESFLDRTLYGHEWCLLYLNVYDSEGPAESAARQQKEKEARAAGNYGYNFYSKESLAKAAQHRAVEAAFDFDDMLHRNEGFIQQVCDYVLAHEQAICTAFNYPTRIEKQALKVESKRAQDAFDAAFAKAGPNDQVDSGYGYLVRKKNYERAQQLGYDGVEYDL